MDPVLAGIFTVPLHLAVEIGDREGLGKFHPGIALDPPDDAFGVASRVRPAAMMVEFKFSPMRGPSRYDRFCCSLAVFEGRSGHNGAHDSTRLCACCDPADDCSSPTSQPAE